MKIYNTFTLNNNYKTDYSNKNLSKRYDTKAYKELGQDAVSFRSSKILNLPESILAKCKTTIKRIIPSGSNSVKPLDLIDMPEKQIVEICQNALKKKLL